MKITNEHIQGSGAVIDAHQDVGQQTRALIERIGGTKPEDLPAEPSIRPLLDHRSRQRKHVAPAHQPALLDDSSGEP